MEPKKIMKARSDLPIKPEKQLTIILNPKSSSEHSETLNRSLSHENKDKRLFESKPNLPRRMDSCVKLLDENFEFNNAALEFLNDASTNYLVVAVLGMQGVGKSMILNLIAQPKPLPNLVETLVQVLFGEDSGTAGREDDDLENPSAAAHLEKNKTDPFKFKIQTLEHIIGNHSCTKGVDMYVTEDRLILLDCQALWSLTSEDPNANANTMTSRNTDPIVGGLQVASYLMSISHVVIAVMDWVTDNVFLKYLQTADMLRPSLAAAVTPSPEGDGEQTSGENHPHLMLVCNKCYANQVSSDTVKAIQETFWKTFQQSKLQLQTGLHLHCDENKNTSIGRQDNLNTSSGRKPINMFILPELPENLYTDRTPYNEYTFDQLAVRMRETVMSAHRHQITNVPNLSERGWFHFANKAWDTIKKCSFFMEYEGFLP